MVRRSKPPGSIDFDAARERDVESAQLPRGEADSQLNMRLYVLLLAATGSLTATATARADIDHAQQYTARRPIAEAITSSTPSTSAHLAEPAPPPTPAKDAPALVSKRAPHVSPTGVHLEFGTGLRFFQGAVVADAPDVNALGMTLAFRGGYYVSPHVGIVAGIEGSAGSLMKGCVRLESSDGRGHCGAYSVKVPVVLQYAVVDRARGLFVEAGASLLNLQVMSARPTPTLEQTVTMFSPVDLALGAGYRVTEAFGNTWLPLEVAARADIGQYWSASETVGETSVSGSLDPSQRAFHVAVTTSVALRF